VAVLVAVDLGRFLLSLADLTGLDDHVLCKSLTIDVEIAKLYKFRVHIEC
jgi:hypothetical protein